MSLIDWLNLAMVLLMFAVGVLVLYDRFVRERNPPPPPPDATAPTYLCARCARTNAAVTYLVAGKLSNLCDECIVALQAKANKGARKGACGMCGEPDRALVAEDGCPVCHDCLGICGEILADRSKRRELSINIERNPNDPQAWAMRADHLAAYGELDASIEDASRAIELDPGFDFAYMCRSFALARRERWAAALDDADAGLRCSKVPENQAVLCNNRARALEGLGRLEEALESIDQAIALDPSIDRFRENRARILSALGRPA